jgi:hypothetical protein
MSTISTKLTITYIISTELIGHKKTTVYNVGNSFPAWGQAQTCGGFKSVNGISTPTSPLLITRSPTAIHI